MKTVTPVELAEELKVENDLFLLDVRESDELAISRLPNVVHIPMGEVANRLDEIPKDKPIVVICRSGGRSGNVTTFLNGNGYENVRNMVTGMNGYASTVDTSLTVY